MKKLLLMLVPIAIATCGCADIILDKPATVDTVTTRPVAVVTTNSIAISAGSKVVWTDFSIRYQPPNYSNAVYTVSYMIQDPVTKREIPRTRKTAHLTQAEVVAFATANGIDFNAAGVGIAALIDKWLATVITPVTP